VETLLRKLDARLEHLGVLSRKAAAAGGGMLEDDVTRKEVGWISEAISMLEGAWERGGGVGAEGGERVREGDRVGGRWCMVHTKKNAKQKVQKGTGLEGDGVWCTHTNTHTFVDVYVHASLRHCVHRNVNALDIRWIYVCLYL